MKRSVILILVLTMIIMATCVGCKDSDTKTEETVTTEATEAAVVEATDAVTEEEEPESAISDEYVEWSVLTVEFVNAPTTDDQLAWQYIADKFNVQFNFEVVNNADFLTRVNLALSSDATPNIICENESRMTKYSDTGVIVDLTPYVEEYAPDMLAEINKDSAVLKNTLDDQGRYFFFPRIQWGYAITYMAMNTGLLGDLGIDVPTTTDGFLDALVAMKASDPEGDLYWMPGTSLNSPLHMYWPIFYAFGTGFQWEHYETGNYLYAPYERSEELRAALAYMNEAYELGVIDPEYESMDADTFKAKFTAGQVAAVYGWSGQLFPRNEEGGFLTDEEYLSGDVDIDYTIIAPLIGPEGYQYNRVPSLTGYGLYLTHTLAEEDIPRAVSLFNWFYTEEGKVYSNFGVEGETYTVDGSGDYVYTDDTWSKGLNEGLRANGIYPANFLMVNMPEAFAQLNPILTIQGIELNEPYSVAVSPLLTPTEEETEIVNQMGTDIQSYVNEMLPKFVNGTLNTAEDFDDFIAQLENMGVEEYCAAIHSQYDRWMER